MRAAGLFAFTLLTVTPWLFPLLLISAPSMPLKMVLESTWFWLLCCSSRLTVTGLPSRSRPRETLLPIGIEPTSARSAAKLLMGFPFREVITSPALMPAFAADEFGMTWLTKAPR